ncbi:MAG: relaxase domain-containing protein [Solirubrobacteraceae bacterium]
MLSLATLQGGTSVTYWLAQAEGRVTHSESVSSGVEDYYLAGPEAVGQWTGEGIAGLGLGGEVTEEALTRLLDRKDPRSGEPLPRPARGRPPEVDGFQNTNVFVVRAKRRSNFGPMFPVAPVARIIVTPRCPPGARRRSRSRPRAPAAGPGRDARLLVASQALVRLPVSQ